MCIRDSLSTGEAVERRQSLRRRAHRYADHPDPHPRDHRIRAGWSAEGWLPFAEFGEGAGLLLQDYSPAEQGAIGQIIAFTHDPDELSYLAPGFAELLDASGAEIAADPEAFVPE